MSGRTTRRLVVLALATAPCVAPTVAHAQAGARSFRVSRLVGDGMVLQRGIAMPVWGWAAPGQRVRVTLDGRSAAATAGATGEWKATLPAHAAGGPYTLTVTAPDTVLRVRDVLVGDVWICSGQSNMELVVADARDGAATIAAADDPMIRQFKVPNSWSMRPASDLAGGQWERADSAHVGQFTAVGYFFAREIRRTQHVPVGLLNTSWSGSRIEPWMNARTSGVDSTALDAIMQRERNFKALALDTLRARLGALPTEDAGMAGGRAVWADPALDDAGWRTIATPGLWERDYPELDGIGWYRASFELTPAEAAAGVRLGLGLIDDSDVSWVNGVEVGRTTNAWNVAREYAVPARALHAGRNVIAVRVEDTGGGGGIYGDSALLFVEAGGARRPLAGAWKFRVGRVEVAESGRRINQIPTVIYNRMVHPLLPYPIKGALWYQGESNADSVADAARYRAQLPAMIRQWRAEWGEGDFPFLWVQLANYMAADSVPRLTSAWATLRESQSAALALPKTAQAVTLDLGDGSDLHPKNKQDVGLRLALAARRVAYGEPIVAAGPTYRAMRVEGGRVRVQLANAAGLAARDRDARATPAPALRGFAIAGADRKFVWADARIEGDGVVVWSDRVPHPVAVRYAWGDNPNTANLYNREGLPAVPFRTDAW